MSESKTVETNSARRPAGSIIAPPRLSFGANSFGGGGGEKSTSSASSNPFGSRVPFSGLKASKLSTVTQALCTSHKDEEEGDKNKTAASVSQKPSFIPLAKDPPGPSESSVSSVSVTSTVSVANTKAESAERKEDEKFVFGQNLDGRAANYASTEKNGKEETKSTETDQDQTPDMSDSKKDGDKERSKTLSESAAEYCENRNKKVEFGEVELITGEENETNVCHMSAKLYIFDKTTSSWMERGRGQLRLNDLRVSVAENSDAPQITSRIIMRTVGSLRVILNSKIFPEMTIEKPTDKNIRLTAMDEMDQGLKVFLLSGASKDVGTFFAAMTKRLETVKKAHSSVPSKRKLPEEDANESDSKNEPPPPVEPPAKEAKLN